MVWKIKAPRNAAPVKTAAPGEPRRAAALWVDWGGLEDVVVGRVVPVVVVVPFRPVTVAGDVVCDLL